MAEGIIDSVIDQVKVEKQIAVVTAALEKMARLVEDMPQIKSLVSGSETSIKKTAQAQTELTATMKEFESLEQKIIKAQAQLNVLESERGKKLAETKLEYQNLNKVQKERIALMNAEQGSIDQLQLKLQKATRIYESLGQAQRDSLRGQTLLAYIQKLSPELNKLEQSTGNFRRNVGNYANSLANGFELVRREIVRLQSDQSKLSIGGDTRGAEAAGRRINELNDIVKVSFDNSKSFDQVVRSLDQNFRTMAQSGNQSNEFLRNFKEFVADAKRESKELKDEIHALSSETRTLDLVTGAISTVASGFQVASGAQALFGAENIDVERTIVKLIAVQNVANGVQQIAKQLTEKSTLAGKAYSLIQKEIAIVTSATATSTQKLNAVLKLSGIGLLITGISLLISKMSSLGNTTEKVVGQMEFLKTTLDGLRESTDRSVEKLNVQTQIAVEHAKQRGATEQEVNDIILAGINEQRLAYEGLAKGQINVIKNLTGIRLESIKNSDEASAALKILKDKQAENNLLITQGNGVVSKLASQQKDAIAGAVNIGESIVSSFKAAETAEVNLLTTGEQQKTKISEEEREKREAAAKKSLEDAKKRIADERKAQLELIQLVQGANRDKNLGLADDENNTTTIRIQSAQRAADAQRIMIRETKKYELEQEHLTESQILAIHTKAQLEINKIELELIKRISTIRQQEVSKLKDLVAQVNAASESDFEKQLAKEQKKVDKSTAQAEKFRDEQLRQNREAFNSGARTEERYNKIKEDIERDYQVTVLGIQLDSYVVQLNLLKKFGKDTTDIEKAIAAARLAIADQGKPPGKGPKTNLEVIRDDLAKAKDAYEEYATFITSFSKALHERELNHIQDKIDAIEKQKEADIDRINASGESEEKKAARIKIVEAKAAADREIQERRKRQIQQEQARFEKATTIAAIILRTALAVITQLTDKTLIGPAKFAAVALTAARGAAELAVAIATPIPKFFKGKSASDPYEGPGIVGDQGREIALLKSGSMALFTKPTLTHLVKGDVILPNKLTENILASLNLPGINTPAGPNTRSLNEDLLKETVSELKELNRKSRITIINNAPIHTDAWIEKNIRK
jgi:hypothetical protein